MIQAIRVRVVVLAALCGLLAAPGAVSARDWTARDVTQHLFQFESGARPDLSGETLSRLDLAGLDFKKATLSKANLFGADLSEANLTGSNLSGANLDRVTLTATRFDGANLDGASLLRPSAFSTLAATTAEAPSFARASLRGIKMFGRFSRASFANADLTDASCAPFGKTGFIEEIFRTEFAGANMQGAILVRADLTHALFAFTDLRGANLRDANLTNADLSGADLTGADLTGANITGAELSGVKLTGVIGFDTVRGLASAHNADKVLR